LTVFRSIASRIQDNAYEERFKAFFAGESRVIQADVSGHLQLKYSVFLKPGSTEN
jgi:hypothetical protein